VKGKEKKMQLNIEKLKVVQPFISGFTILVLIALIVFSIYFGENNKTWILFLSGILVMAVIAEASNISKMERVAIHRDNQLTNVKSELGHETQLRERAEEEIATNKSRLILIDEELPIMVALIDSGGMCQYYNRTFMEW